MPLATDEWKFQYTHTNRESNMAKINRFVFLQPTVCYRLSRYPNTCLLSPLKITCPYEHKQASIYFTVSYTHNMYGTRRTSLTLVGDPNKKKSMHAQPKLEAFTPVYCLYEHASCGTNFDQNLPHSFSNCFFPPGATCANLAA